MVKRIAITGPESTGKSELAEKLARHYDTVWVPEYAREYLEKLVRPYDYDDIAEIARGQLRNEEQVALSANRILFCDTDMIVTKIWSEFKYGRCDHWILDQVANHHYDIYLLCDIDLPWADDPLREHPGKRKELFEQYFQELQKRDFPFVVISGVGDDRTNNAILAIERTFKINIMKNDGS